MQQIILNDGTKEKIPCKLLNNNNHAKGLITIDGLQEYYNLTVKDLPFTRNVDDMPRLPYKQLNIYNQKTTRHYGQRKLCLSEIEFLTIMFKKFNLKDKPIVNILYIGAAAGQHIPLLPRMFSNIHFFLYDPNKFAINLNDENINRIEINQRLFIDSDVNRFIEMAKKSPLLLISDIRNNNYNIHNNDIKLIREDMNIQKNWTQQIKPLGAMFKFRLPFYNPKKGVENIEYFVGNNYLPVWGPLSTTETRLICNIDDTKNWSLTKLYDNKVHEERMFYFNNCYRMNIFRHNFINGVKGLCWCCDCTSEITIISNYLYLFNMYNVGIIAQIMNDLSELTNRNLNSPNRFHIDCKNSDVDD